MAEKIGTHEGVWVDRIIIKQKCKYLGENNTLVDIKDIRDLQEDDTVVQLNNSHTYNLYLYDHLRKMFFIERIGTYKPKKEIQNA